MQMTSGMIRHSIFVGSIVIAVAMILKPINDLFQSPLQRDYHSLIPVIPIVSLYLLIKKRKAIITEADYGISIGVIVVCIGFILYMLGLIAFSGKDIMNHATLAASSSIIVIWGGFITAYGTKVFRQVSFSLLFLIFAIPMPSKIMEELITFLQTGSTEFANLLLWISGVPFIRDGYVFQLPGIGVEVAKQCSGIRSGIALLITATLASHLFLGTYWKKVIFLLCVIPITLLKNGLRITALALLGAYVDPRILQSSLHREGGIPFFIVALFLMAPILLYLRRTEKNIKSQVNAEDLNGGNIQ
jgi:exosortase